MVSTHRTTFFPVDMVEEHKKMEFGGDLVGSAPAGIPSVPLVMTPRR